MFTQYGTLYVSAQTLDSINADNAEKQQWAAALATPATKATRNNMPTPKGVMPRTHRMYQLVLAGYSNADAVAVIKAEYGDSVPTTNASIAWVRNSLKPGNSKNEYAVKVLRQLPMTN